MSKSMWKRTWFVRFSRSCQRHFTLDEAAARDVWNEDDATEQINSEKTNRCQYHTLIQVNQQIKRCFYIFTSSFGNTFKKHSTAEHFYCIFFRHYNSNRWLSTSNANVNIYGSETNENEGESHENTQHVHQALSLSRLPRLE